MIESVSNEKVKAVIALQKKAQERKVRGSFVTEGERSFFDLLLHAKAAFSEIYVTEAFLSEKKERLDAAGVNDYEVVTERVMDAMADTKTPQGILGIAKMPKWEEEAVFDTGHTLFALDGVRDPGNLGTIFRTALAAGIGGLLLSKDCADVFQPKVVRATMSAVCRMPFVETDDLASLLKGRQKAGDTVYVSVVEKDAESCFACVPDKKSIVVLGNEANGVSDEVLALADKKISIPMANGLESLNVAAAAAVLMYQFSDLR